MNISMMQEAPTLTEKMAVGSKARLCCLPVAELKVTKRVRVAIADDDPDLLREIARLLETRFDVVSCAENGRELVEAVRRLSPAVVVADITMPEMNGIEAARLITKRYPAAKVVMFSVHDDPVFVEAAFEAGASGYVLKSGPFNELISAIEDVLAGRTHEPRDLAWCIASHPSKNP